jgi:hypothetical protein
MCEEPRQGTETETGHLPDTSLQRYRLSQPARLQALRSFPNIYDMLAVSIHSLRNHFSFPFLAVYNFLLAGEDFAASVLLLICA